MQGYALYISYIFYKTSKKEKNKSNTSLKYVSSYFLKYCLMIRVYTSYTFYTCYTFLAALGSNILDSDMHYIFYNFFYEISKKNLNSLTLFFSYYYVLFNAIIQIPSEQNFYILCGAYTIHNIYTGLTKYFEYITIYEQLLQ